MYRTPIEDPYVPEYTNDNKSLTPYELRNMLENAHLLIKDQVGCRLLQHKLDERQPQDIQLISNYLSLYYCELMCDPFGNYLIQRLMELQNGQQQEKLIQIINEKLITICMDQHGTRAIQKLVTVMQSYNIQVVTEILQKHICELARDVNGNHVIQKCLTLQYPANQFIYEAIQENLLDMSSHRHGCCVIQKSIDAANEQQLQQLMNNIISNSIQLVQDTYGNYVIQHILDRNQVEINNRLAKQFQSKIVQLSTHKFSSNVIEKCLMQTSREVQLAMLNEITKPSHVCYLLGDQYSNYVVQKALSIAPKQLQDKILKDIQPHIVNLKKTKFGKRVYQKITKKYPQLLK